ncbi:MAG: hypothetical protein ACE5JS_17350 [Nitrospinota bacterium]
MRDDVTAAQLITTSPSSISQTVDTPSTPTDVKFIRRFETTTGLLRVTLGGVELGTIPAPPSVTTAFQPASFPVPGSLLNMTGLPLKFEIDGPAGSTVLLDNIQFPGLSNGNFATEDLSSWTASGNASVLVIESPEDATIQINRARVVRRSYGDTFVIEGLLLLGPESDGINLPDEAVSVALGQFSETFPPDSFVRDDANEHFQFADITDGIRKIQIHDNGEFVIRGVRVDLGGTNFDNPVLFSLRIGNDLGQVLIRFLELRRLHRLFWQLPG